MEVLRFGGCETYQTASGINPRVARPHAVEPFRLPKLPESIFGHGDGGRG